MTEDKIETKEDKLTGIPQYTKVYQQPEEANIQRILIVNGQGTMEFSFSSCTPGEACGLVLKMMDEIKKRQHIDKKRYYAG